MTYVTPLAPVSEAIVATLTGDATWAGLCTGGLFDVVPQSPTYPFTQYFVTQDKELGGFGTKAGSGTLPLIAIRLHAYSKYAGMTECQSIIGRAIYLLRDAPAVAGYSSWAIFHRPPVLPIADSVINGERVQEIVASFGLYVEES